ncbi:MAG: hypothetical protein HYZ14_06285 [Bacteroidetes bacterium]|nr:hypothetical protein [Bacteroidota bacterium]
MKSLSGILVFLFLSQQIASSAVNSSVLPTASDFSDSNLPQWREPYSSLQNGYCVDRIGDKVVAVYKESFFYPESSNTFITIFDADFSILFHEEVSKPKEIAGCKLHSGLIFQNQLVFFLSGKTDDVEKGNQGVFKWTFDTEKLAFNPPVLIEQFPETGSITRLVVNQSANGEFLSLVIEPKTFCEVYDFGLTVIDKNFKPVLTDKEAKGELQACMKFNNCYVTNTGDAYLIFDESSEDYNQISTFQKQNDYACVISYHQSATETVNHLAFENRGLLGYDFVENDGNAQLFVSWYYLEESARCGISTYDLATKTEKQLHEFDAQWVEPFIQARIPKFSYSQEASRENESTDETRNILFNLKYTVKHNHKTTYIIEKHMPMVFHPSSNSTLQHMYILYTGDLLFLQFDDTDQLTNKAKVERHVIHRDFADDFLVQQNGNELTVLYHSQVPEDSKDDKNTLRTYYASSMHNMPPNHLFKTVLNLDSFESETTLITDYASGSNFENKYLWLRTSFTDSGVPVLLYVPKKESPGLHRLAVQE